MNGSGGSRVRRWTVTAAVVVVAVATAIGAAVVTTRNGQTGISTRSSAPVGTATVQRTTLVSRSSVTGTLGYEGSFTVAPALTGVLTSAGAVGSVVVRGQRIFSVNNTASYLLYGQVPTWRVYTPWSTAGPDIAQLRANLAAMGYLPRSRRSDQSGWDLTEAVQRWQRHLGLPVTGELTRGQVVFAPRPLRITAIAAAVGTAVNAGSALITATSTTVAVTAAVDPVTAATLRPGNQVVVSTPDGQRRPAVIASIATVATSTPSPDGATPAVSVPVAIRFSPAWTPRGSAVDQAPVSIAITVRRVPDVLAVPVTALLAISGNAYAVEVQTAARAKTVPVTTGLFDDLSGLVQVTGALRAGQTVVVAAS